MKYLILTATLLTSSVSFATDTQAICTNTATGAQLKLIKIYNEGNGRFEMNEPANKQPHL